METLNLEGVSNRMPEVFNQLKMRNTLQPQNYT